MRIFLISHSYHIYYYCTFCVISLYPLDNTVGNYYYSFLKHVEIKDQHTPKHRSWQPSLLAADSICLYYTNKFLYYTLNKNSFNGRYFLYSRQQVLQQVMCS